MIGVVLAAGAGRRLHPLTDDLPKTLLDVADDTTILDIALHNLASVGLEDVVVVTGFASHQIDSRVDSLQRRHGVRIRTVFNDKALVWNNAYSLWLAREFFAEGVILCNGDVTHCCYDYDGTQKLGNVRESSIAEIASSPFLDTIEEGFRAHDFDKLPRCAECFKNPAATPPLTDRIWRYAQAFPWKDPFRRLLNLPNGEN